MSHVCHSKTLFQPIRRRRSVSTNRLRESWLVRPIPCFQSAWNALNGWGANVALQSMFKGFGVALETIVWHVVYLYTCVLFGEMHLFVYEKPLITAIWMKTFSRFKWLFIHFFLLLMQRLLYSLDVLFKKPCVLTLLWLVTISTSQIT